jgi:AraC-like DNA-binding protein
LQYHHHGIPFATIVLGGSYTEVREAVPRAHASGTVVVHGQGEEHADHFTGDTVCLNIELPIVGGAVGRVVHVASDAELRGAVADVARTFRRGDESQLCAAATRVQSLLAREPDGNSPPHWVRYVMGAFAWSDARPLREAARVAGVHPTHFSREFRRYIGLTPSAYRRWARIGRASALLLTTSASLSRIALQCGFNDQSHLTRTFSEALGIAPGAYRRIFSR